MTEEEKQLQLAFLAKRLQSINEDIETLAREGVNVRLRVLSHTYRFLNEERKCDRLSAKYETILVEEE